MLYYNSEDGGQTNVQVRVAGSITIFDTELYTIYGRDLASPTELMGCGVLTVRMSTVTANPLATITQLHR